MKTVKMKVSTSMDYLDFLMEVKNSIDRRKKINISKLASKYRLKYATYASLVMVKEGLVKRVMNGRYSWETSSPNIYMAKELESRINKLGSKEARTYKSEYRKQMKELVIPKTTKKQRVQLNEGVKTKSVKPRKSRKITNNKVSYYSISMLFGLITIKIKANYENI